MMLQKVSEKLNYFPKYVLCLKKLRHEFVLKVSPVEEMCTLVTLEAQTGSGKGGGCWGFASLCLFGKLDFRACLWVLGVSRTVQSNMSDLHG